MPVISGIKNSSWVFLKDVFHGFCFAIPLITFISTPCCATPKVKVHKLFMNISFLFDFCVPTEKLRFKFKGTTFT